VTEPKTQETPVELIEFSEKTMIKLQKLVYELTKMALYGTTTADIDSLCEMASLAEDVNYELVYKTLDRPHRELASSIDVMCNAVLRVFHGLNDITALTPQILEGFRSYAPALDWTRYCCRHIDLPDAGEKTDVCGHLSVIRSGTTIFEYEAELLLLHEGMVKLMFANRDDWLACRPIGDTSNPVFFRNLKVDLDEPGEKIVMWLSGESKVIGGGGE
jgi:hypothetical protein